MSFNPHILFIWWRTWQFLIKTKKKKSFLKVPEVSQTSFLTIFFFYIFHKSSIKFFLKWSINKYPKITHLNKLKKKKNNNNNNLFR